MTYFETPEHAEAYARGMSLDAYSEFLAAAEREAEDDSVQRNLDPERFVSEDDFDAATPQEWTDLQNVLDWEAFEGH